MIGLQTMTLGVDSGWLAILQAMLWLTTGVGLLLEIAFPSTESAPHSIGPLRAIMFSALGLSAALLPIGVMMVSLFAVAGARGGVAPATDFEARRAWGERVYGPYLKYIDEWVAKADVVREDVGEVLKIAPLDGPNRYQGGFTDGAYAVMNLEVIGTQGRGVLHLPYVEIWNTGQLQSIGCDATWKFAGETEIVAKSGKSYLAEHGLESIYLELLALAAEGEAERFVERWDDLEIALAHSGLEPRSERIIDALRDEYRGPLLVHLGTALAKLNRNEESAEVFRNSAAPVLARVERLLQEEDSGPQSSQIPEQLRYANALLKKAESQVPGHKDTLKLARERVVLYYLHSIGGRPRAGYNGDLPADQERAEDQAWAEKCLGILYTEAAEYPRRSPYLLRELGEMRIGIDSGGLDQVYVNNDNVYAASVYLQLDGEKKSGVLNVRISENEERCEPIDLFADDPRSLDYPLSIRSPYWREEGKKRVKLSAKTGEPMRKKSRPVE